MTDENQEYVISPTGILLLEILRIVEPPLSDDTERRLIAFIQSRERKAFEAARIWKDGVDSQDIENTQNLINAELYPTFDLYKNSEEYKK